MWNRIPNVDSGYSPEGLFSRTKLTHVDINRARVWGSPLYVLDPKLQDGKKIPKWEKLSTTGIFMGFSPTHSLTVSLALNINTGSVTPQFNSIHDGLFTTIHNFGTHNLDELYDKLSIISRHNDHEPDIDDFDKDIPAPSVSKEWSNTEEMKLKREQKRLRFRRLYGRESRSISHNDLIEHLPISSPSSSVPDLHVQSPSSPSSSSSTPSSNINSNISDINSIDDFTTSLTPSPNLGIDQSIPPDNTPFPNLRRSKRSNVLIIIYMVVKLVDILVLHRIHSFIV